MDGSEFIFSWSDLQVAVRMNRSSAASTSSTTHFEVVVRYPTPFAFVGDGHNHKSRLSYHRLCHCCCLSNHTKRIRLKSMGNINAKCVNVLTHAFKIFRLSLLLS